MPGFAVFLFNPRTPPDPTDNLTLGVRSLKPRPFLFGFDAIDIIILTGDLARAYLNEYVNFRVNKTRVVAKF